MSARGLEPSPFTNPTVELNPAISERLTRSTISEYNETMRGAEIDIDIDIFNARESINALNPQNPYFYNIDDKFIPQYSDVNAIEKFKECTDKFLRITQIDSSTNPVFIIINSISFYK